MTSLTLPLPISDNALHVLTTRNGRRDDGSPRKVLTPEARDVLTEAGWLIRVWIRQSGWTRPQRGTKVVMEYTIFWPDARPRDPGHLIKILGDTLKGIAIHDDNILLPRAMNFLIDRRHPWVVVPRYPVSDPEP